MSNQRLSNDELVDIAAKLGVQNYEFLIKKIQKVVNQIRDKTKGDTINNNDFFNIIIMALTSSSVSILNAMCETFEDKKGNKINMASVMQAYISNVLSILKQEEQMEIKEKMN